MQRQAENAFDARMILPGPPDDDVADQVDVCRSTIYRWKNFRAAFVERPNLRRAEIWGERPRAGLDEAVNALVMQIRDGTSIEKFHAA